MSDKKLEIGKKKSRKKSFYLSPAALFNERILNDVQFHPLDVNISNILRFTKKEVHRTKKNFFIKN